MTKKSALRANFAFGVFSRAESTFNWTIVAPPSVDYKESDTKVKQIYIAILGF